MKSKTAETPKETKAQTHVRPSQILQSTLCPWHFFLKARKKKKERAPLIFENQTNEIEHQPEEYL